MPNLLWTFEGMSFRGALPQGVKQFPGRLDEGYPEDPADVENKEIPDFLKIRRRDHSMSDFVTRYNMASRKCSGHRGGNHVTLPKKVVSTLLLDAAAIANQDGKLFWQLPSATRGLPAAEWISPKAELFRRHYLRESDWACQSRPVVHGRRRQRR